MAAEQNRLLLFWELGSTALMCQVSLAQQGWALFCPVLSRPGSLGDKKRPRFVLQHGAFGVEGLYSCEVMGCWVNVTHGVCAWGLTLQVSAPEGLQGDHSSVHLHPAPPHPVS